jgi:hypothetical protein
MRVAVAGSYAPGGTLHTGGMKEVRLFLTIETVKPLDPLGATRALNGLMSQSQ